MNEKNKKIEEIFKNEEKVKYLCSLNTPEEAQKAFAEEGVDLTLDELNELRDAIIRAIDNKGELSEDDLEQASGGFIIAGLWTLATWAVTGGAAYEAIKQKW